MKYKGTGVAIVTPFQQNGEIDFNSLENIINHLIDGGVNYIVSLGTTGESVTLTKEEKKQIVQATLKVVNHRIPVMVGCGGNNTAQVISDMKEMESWADFDCFLSVSPYYNKPSQEGIYQHYKAVAEATQKDIMLYNVPGRTSRNIDSTIIFKLANDYENIIGIKEAGNNTMQSAKLAMSKPENFTLVSGDDDLLLMQLAHGFDGVISVVANAYPAEWSQVVKDAQANNFGPARETFHSLFDFVELIFEENNPAGIKCAMNEMGLCENQFRLPVTPVADDLDQRLRAFVRAYR